MKSSTQLDSALFQLTQPGTTLSRSSGTASSSPATLSTSLEMLWFQGHMGGREGPDGKVHYSSQVHVVSLSFKNPVSLLFEPSFCTIQRRCSSIPSLFHLKNVLNPH
ncbi:hypothetical protein ACFXTO_021753 [Malus domestica]